MVQVYTALGIGGPTYISQFFQKLAKPSYNLRVRERYGCLFLVKYALYLFYHNRALWVIVLILSVFKRDVLAPFQPNLPSTLSVIGEYTYIYIYMCVCVLYYICNIYSHQIDV